MIGDLQNSDNNVEHPRKEKDKNKCGPKIMLFIKDAVASEEGSSINNEVGLSPPIAEHW